MSPTLLAEITIFALAVFVGFEVISKVPVVLHTPLMSGTNAIHGIVVVGGIVVLSVARTPVEIGLGFVAVAFGAANLVGGFLVTDRMREMFNKKPKGKA
jgi:NAD(P) transhydrogenase subunit alpha